MADEDRNREREDERDPDREEVLGLWRETKGLLTEIRDLLKSSGSERPKEPVDVPAPPPAPPPKNEEPKGPPPKRRKGFLEWLW